MKYALLVFLGGGAGSVARYLLSIKFNNIEDAIPYGTLLANVLGSLIIGLIFGYMAKAGAFNSSYFYLLAVGFCGGFTTFSTFSYESHLYLKNGDYFSLIPYIFGSLIAGIIAVFVGIYLSKLL